MKKKIAVLTSGWTVDYVLSVLEGMRKVCEKNNTDLFVFTCYKYVEPSGASNTTSFTVFDLINFSEYDGIVIMPNLFNDEAMVQKYASKILESGVPAVSIGRRMDGFHFVGSDNSQAAKDLVLHIIKDHGADKFAFIGGPEGDEGSESGYNLFKSALEIAGLSEKSEIFHVQTDWTFNSAYEKLQVFFENKEKVPNAIVCLNNSLAMAATKAAVEHNYSVPDDIIIIAFEDGDMSAKIIPSLTAVNVNPDQIGGAAIDMLLQNPEELSEKVIQASVFKRQSCGCKRKITPEQKIYSQGYVKEIDKEQRFTSQLRFLEDTFLRNITVEDLRKDLQKYYEIRHFFEGPDFTLFISEDVVNNMTETLTDSNSHTTFSKKMQSFANIKNGRAVPQCTINTSDLLAPSMKSEESATYLILPIFIQKYIYGYYVSKNFNGLLLNKAAYNWTRNVGNSIEKYRLTSVYRRMSEQLQVLSTHDALSGLMNRSALHTYGTELFINNNASKKSTEVIFVDINDMKYINDRFGHLQGDLAIKTVAEAISSSVPKDYICVRYGGDEFVIVGTAEKETIDYCEKIAQQLNEKAVAMSLPYPLTASIGAKVFQPNEKEFLNDAIEIVDDIMYIKKNEYHNR